MLLIIAATPLETSQVRQRMQPAIGPLEGLYCGATPNGQKLFLLHTGIGSASTAITLTRFLERETPQTVLMIGCAGSYPSSGLQIGDLALATEEIFGDLGVMTEQDFQSLEEMNIRTTPPPVQRITLKSKLQKAVSALLFEAVNDQQSQMLCGPFVTVNTCSGHPQLSRELESRTGGICENMEGAAAAQACALYQIPFLELRGISNPTGTREPELWDLKRGTEAAQWGLNQILNNWPRLEKNLCNN